MARPDVTYVEVTGVPPLEVAVEVPRATLETYGLTLDEVAMFAPRHRCACGWPRYQKGELLVRVSDHDGSVPDTDIVLRTSPNGSVLAEDAATIRDGYEELDQATYYNGRPAIRVTAYRVGSESPQQISDAMHEYVEEIRAKHRKRLSFPSGMMTHRCSGRIGLLVRNAGQGFILVLLILYLFLNTRLAFG